MSRGIIYDDVTDPSGNGIVGATVAIYISDGLYTTLAELWDAQVDGNPISNPLTTGERGIFTAFADTGEYDLRVTSSGGDFDRPQFPVVDADDIADIADSVAAAAASAAEALDSADDAAASAAEAAASVVDALRTVATLAELQGLDTGVLTDGEARIVPLAGTYIYTLGDFSGPIGETGGAYGAVIKATDTASTVAAWVLDDEIMNNESLDMEVGLSPATDPSVGFNKGMALLRQDGGEILFRGQYESASSFGRDGGIRSGNVRGVGHNRPANIVSGGNRDRAYSAIYTNVDGGVAFTMRSTVNNSQRLSFEGFSVNATGDAITSATAKGFSVTNMQGMVFDRIGLYNFQGGTGFLYEITNHSGGQGTFNNTLSNFYSYQNNRAFHCKLTGGTSRPRAGILSGWECENFAGADPVCFDIEAGDWSIHSPKIAGTGGYTGKTTAFRVADTASSVAVFGGHIEDGTPGGNMQFLTQEGRGGFMSVGHDATFGAHKVVAENHNKVTIMPSYAPFAEGCGVGQNNGARYRSTQSHGLMIDSTYFAGIQGATLQPLNPNGNFAYWPARQGTTKDYGNVTPPTDKWEQLIGGVWEAASQNVEYKRTTDSLFGGYALQIYDYQNDVAFSGNHRIARFRITDPAVIARYIGKKIAMSTWAKRSGEYGGTCTPGVRVGYVSTAEGTVYTQSYYSDAQMKTHASGDWSYISAEHDNVLPSDTTAILFDLVPRSLNSLAATGAAIFDGVVCNVGGINVWDAVKLMGNTSCATGEVHRFLSDNALNKVNTSPVTGTVTPNFVGEEVLRNNRWFKSTGLTAAAWVPIGSGYEFDFTTTTAAATTAYTSRAMSNNECIQLKVIGRMVTGTGSQVAAFERTFVWYRNGGAAPVSAGSADSYTPIRVSAAGADITAISSGNSIAIQLTTGLAATIPWKLEIQEL